MILIRNSLPESTRQGKRKVKTVILLQIVLVSPATHLVKNDQSHSRTNESQLKKNESFRLILFGPWAKTDSKTLYMSLPKSKYSPSTYSTKKTCNSHRNHTNRIFYQNIFRRINWPLCPTGMHAMNYCFYVFRRGNWMLTSTTYQDHRENILSVVYQRWKVLVVALEAENKISDILPQNPHQTLEDSMPLSTYLSLLLQPLILEHLSLRKVKKTTTKKNIQGFTPSLSCHKREQLDRTGNAQSSPWDMWISPKLIGVNFRSSPQVLKYNYHQVTELTNTNSSSNYN